ncbi:MAG: serine/threonine protein kinase [Acidobacteria bacterium]|nr:serine/threonine protein kinase [Acidobacteriota bacterium]
MPLPLTPERWQRLQQVFDGLVELPADQQAAALAREAEADPDLAAEVAAMLAHEAAAAGRLREVIGETVDQSAVAGAPPRRFGGYRVVREVGRGGMGIVYEGTSDDEFQRRVAIKVAPWAGAGALLDARFRLERQILSGLDHPHIARFLDGGAEGAQPYFVMEFVDGVPLTTHVRTARLDVRQRVALVRGICGALDYAHQHLVVHRDLKPSNILVTPDGIAKVLDFGIAKLLGSDAAETGATLGLTSWTPDYASPEQVLGKPVSTRSDVYSLGLVLYEVLTGEAAQNADTSSPVALTRSVCETEPPPPSARAAAAGDRALARELRGDLDRIVAMAIRKEPERRYASMAAFADDLGRWLDGLPVAARPSTWRYRAGKFVARHRVAAVAVVLVAVSIAGGTTAAVYQARRAERRFAQVRGLANAFVFDVHDRVAALPGATEARRAIVRTALTYLENLREEATGDAALAHELAAAYERIGTVQGHPLSPNLGEPDAALQSYARAEALLAPFDDASAGADTLVQVATVALRQAQVLRARGDVAASQRAYERARDAGERGIRGGGTRAGLSVVGEVHAEMARASMDRRDVAAAEVSSARAMAVADELLALDPSDADLRNNVASALNALGVARVAAGRLEEAAASFARSASVREDLVRDAPTNINYRRSLMVSYGSLADVLGARAGENLGNIAGATAALEKATALARATAAEDAADRRARFDVVNALLRLGALLADNAAAPATALTPLLEADGLNATLLAEEPASDRYGYVQIVIDRRIGRVLAAAGRNADAAARFERVRARAPKLLSGPNGPSTRSQLLQATIDLARIRAAAGDARATALAHEATSGLAGTPITPANVAATLQADLGRVWLSIAAAEPPAARAEALARAAALASDSRGLWTAAKLPAAIEPQRTAALAALDADRARAAALTRP